MSKYNTEDKKILRTLVLAYKSHDIVVKRKPNSSEIKDMLKRNNDYDVTTAYINYIIKNAKL